MNSRPGTQILLIRGSRTDITVLKRRQFISPASIMALLPSAAHEEHGGEPVTLRRAGAFGGQSSPGTAPVAPKYLRGGRCGYARDPRQAFLGGDLRSTTGGGSPGVSGLRITRIAKIQPQQA